MENVGRRRRSAAKKVYEPLLILTHFINLQSGTLFNYLVNPLTLIHTLNYDKLEKHLI